ncbi:MAG TPA: response regulator [Candidatus Eisenbacteria bacterium]|nr:response regulator [Candidatus Eisenbacteria bacterium]
MRLRVLHLEDDPRDAELIGAELEASGYTVTIERVASEESFTARLREGGFDLILSDFALPGFDGLAALRIAREVAPEVPFISVSGRLGEEAAVECVRAGATDYVLKQRLSRLGTAVRRALVEAGERRKRREAEEALQRSEAQLRQAQKMEAIGLLAGGVAHDFNNLLTAIMGYSQLLQLRVGSDARALADTEEILLAAERAASLTRQLLAFSRQQVLEPRVLDLNTVVANLDKMLRRLIGEDIDLLSAPAADTCLVMADPGQIEQVLMNLAINARDAMSGGGKLTIETATVDLEEGFARAQIDIKPGRYVMLAVSDTGCGMTPEIASRIFDPFFTTKEQGRGTGLGLSMVHGIVKQSGGYIETYTELGQGTTFKVYLPRLDGDEQPYVRPSAGGACAGSETVLLVEDEESIRRVLRQSLELHGYAVLEAGDGTEAVSICERRDQAIDLLVTDVVMPLMSGPELAQRLTMVRPNLPVLFISGYTDRALVHQGLRAANTAFLQKPFTPDVLARKVREILDGPRTKAA